MVEPIVGVGIADQTVDVVRGVGWPLCIYHELSSGIVALGMLTYDMKLSSFGSQSNCGRE